MGDRAQRSHKGAFVERSNAALNSNATTETLERLKQFVCALIPFCLDLSAAFC